MTIPSVIQLYEEKLQEESESSDRDQVGEMTEEEILVREMLEIFGKSEQEFVVPPMSTSNVRFLTYSELSYKRHF